MHLWYRPCRSFVHQVNGLFNPVQPAAQRIGRYDAHARMRGAVCFTSCRRVQTAAAHILAAPLAAHDDFDAWRKQHCDHESSLTASVSASASHDRGNERRRNRRRRSATGHDLDTSVLSAFARDADDNVDSLDESGAARSK
jgi:hypothetical protein